MKLTLSIKFLLLIQSKKTKILFVCQGTSTKRQRRDLFGLRVKLPHFYYQSNHSNVEAIRSSALPKDTKSELAGLASHYPFLMLKSSREAVNNNF